MVTIQTEPTLSLIEAVRLGNIGLIKKLLSSGHNPEHREEFGWTVIHECAEQKQFIALSIILEHDPEIKSFLSNLRTDNNETPLFIACAVVKKPSLEIVNILLQAGADPNVCAIGCNWPSALHYACLTGDRAFCLAKLLIKYGANVDIGSHGRSPVHMVCDEPVGVIDQHLVKYLVNLSDVDVIDGRKESLLIKACANNNVDIVKLILKKSTERINYHCEEGFVPLSAAAEEGNLKIVQLLVQSGANIDAYCSANTRVGDFFRSQCLPIHSSLNTDNIEVFKYFLEFTDPEMLMPFESHYNHHHHFPVYVMFYANRPEFFEALMQHKFPAATSHLQYSWIRNVIMFITTSKVPPERELLLLERFKLFFKYYRHFEPESVFESFSCLLSDSQLKENIRFLHVLSKMGISWNQMVGFSKQRIISLLSNDISIEKIWRPIVDETLLRLTEPVLSLKQMSRVTVRRAVGLMTANEWCAYKIIRDSPLPLHVKEYIWYQELD